MPVGRPRASIALVFLVAPGEGTVSKVDEDGTITVDFDNADSRTYDIASQRKREE